MLRSGFAGFTHEEPTFSALIHRATGQEVQTNQRLWGGGWKTLLPAAPFNKEKATKRLLGGFFLCPYFALNAFPTNRAVMSTISTMRW